MLRASFSLLALRYLRVPPRLRGGAPSLGGVRWFCSSDEELSDYNPIMVVPSEREAKEIFEKWCKEYEKTYSSEEEKAFRFGLFKENLAYCALRNSQGPRCFGPTHFADLTREECECYFGEVSTSSEDEMD